LTINGQRHYLWRAVDQDDNVLDIWCRATGTSTPPRSFFASCLRGCSTCHASSSPISSRVRRGQARDLAGVEHRQSRYLNNRCENSHRPTRQRERRMQGFKSAGHAQRFLSAYGPIAQHFRPRRHLLSASGIVRRCGTASRVGRKSRVANGRPKRWVGGNRVRKAPSVAW